MENADTPALPQPMIEVDGEVYSTLTNYGESQSGFTKRESFAKDLDVSSQFKRFLRGRYSVMFEFIGEPHYGNKLTDVEILNLELRVTAKLKVMAANALLVELDKFQTPDR